MTSWSQALAQLAEMSLLCVFTCANDFSDARGEVGVMASVVGMQFVMTPTQSPFSACSTFHAPGARDTDWSCANAYVYCVRGYREGRSTTMVDLGDSKSLQAALSRVHIVGKTVWR